MGLDGKVEDGVCRGDKSRIREKREEVREVRPLKNWVVSNKPRNRPMRPLTPQMSQIGPILFCVWTPHISLTGAGFLGDQVHPHEHPGGPAAEAPVAGDHLTQH